MVYEIDGDFINENEDLTSWVGFDIGEISTPEDCLGMIMTMISDSEYEKNEDIIDDVKMMLDDIYQYAELGLQLSRE